jgi:hypothetical protein
MSPISKAFQACGSKIGWIEHDVVFLDSVAGLLLLVGFLSKAGEKCGLEAKRRQDFPVLLSRFGKALISVQMNLYCLSPASAGLWKSVFIRQPSAFEEIKKPSHDRKSMAPHKANQG